MWPVYLSQMWISRHTCHLSFFCISCSCSSKHLKRLQLRTGGCLYYQVSDHFEKPMDGMQWNKCIGFEICICFKHVAILNSAQWTTWLEQNVLLTAGCGQSHCLRGPWLGPPRWPTGCLSSTCKPTTIALSTLSETHSGTAAETLTVHEQQVQTYSAEVPPLSSGTHLLGNLCSKFMWGQINQSFIRYCIILSKNICTL